VDFVSIGMWLLPLIYFGLLGIGFFNWIWIKRPRGEGRPCFEVMIPARDEADNIAKAVVPLVQNGARVTVFDDDSSDGTAGIALGVGALVLKPKSPLPVGWTGKNSACHQLSLVSSSPWTVFLDADTVPTADFVSRLSAFLGRCDPDTKVISGFPKMIPGKGIEPAYLTWVSWILLATNPFALVSRTGMGHNRFTNGQFSAWRTECLHEVKPYETVKSEVLEDVQIGRLLHRLKIRVEIIDISEVLSVKMYRDVREAVNGMSKNSCDIMGNPFSSVVLALFLLWIAWGWILLGGYGLFLLLPVLLAGKLVTDRAAGAPLWVFLFAPFTITAGALTILRSTLLKRKGKVTWKGRTY
jgi:cellulose synthase/poly-beta-1,6-N-acetylglucosamine synthase-like glycosyltransferase